MEIDNRPRKEGPSLECNAANPRSILAGLLRATQSWHGLIRAPCACAVLVCRYLRALPEKDFSTLSLRLAVENGSFSFLNLWPIILHTCFLLGSMRNEGLWVKAWLFPLKPISISDDLPWNEKGSTQVKFGQFFVQVFSWTKEVAKCTNKVLDKWQLRRNGLSSRLQFQLS